MHEAHEVPLARQVAESFRELCGCMGRGDHGFPASISRTRCIADVCLLNALWRLGCGWDAATVGRLASHANLSTEIMTLMKAGKSRLEAADAAVNGCPADLLPPRRDPEPDS